MTASAFGAPWRRDLAGGLEELSIESEVLRGNPLGDPHVRPIWVYTPPGYDGGEARLPAIYMLQGMTGQLDMWGNRSAFRPTWIERLDALFGADDAPPPCLVVMVDCWTSLGGSQFIDSPGTGRYHTYLCDEIVPLIDARYRTMASREHRGVAGKSSGGYGAMVTPMLRPDLFGGLATHAGDAIFECSYALDFPLVVRALRDNYEGSFERFWSDFRSREAMTRHDDGRILNAYCMAACYSADPDGTVRIPFDTDTGELLPEVWRRWLAWDPVRMVAGHADALRSLRAVYIDAGRRDEFFLDLGAQAFHRALQRIGVTDVHLELFDGGHMSIEYRYPIAIRYLAERLAAPSRPPGVAGR